MTPPNRSRRSRLLGPALAAALVLGGSACDTNAPDTPGDRLDVDGESPLITEPGGVGNQITNDEITGDDGLRD